MQPSEQYAPTAIEINFHVSAICCRFLFADIHNLTLWRPQVFTKILFPFDLPISAFPMDLSADFITLLEPHTAYNLISQLFIKLTSELDIVATDTFGAQQTGVNRICLAKFRQLSNLISNFPARL
jgi:hypothetical protein